MSSGRPDGSRTRYSCAIGMIGTLTPASAPISRAYMPPALITMPVSITPLSVSTPVTSPRSSRDAGDARVGVDLGAAPPCALGERERELARIDVAVAREIGGPEHAVGRHRREERLRLGRRDELEREAERLRPAGLARDLLQPLGRRGEAQRADLTPARLEPDLRLERAVELDRVHHHPRQRQRAAQLADEPGGVERRAARQVGALDEHDVVPAEPREPVEDGAPADTAADDDGAGASISRADLDHSEIVADSISSLVRSARNRSRANSTGVPSPRSRSARRAATARRGGRRAHRASAGRRLDELEPLDGPDRPQAEAVAHQVVERAAQIHVLDVREAPRREGRSLDRERLAAGEAEPRDHDDRSDRFRSSAAATRLPAGSTSAEIGSTRRRATLAPQLRRDAAASAPPTLPRPPARARTCRRPGRRRGAADRHARGRRAPGAPSSG